MRAWKKFWNSDVAWSWRHSPVAIFATILVIILFVGAFGAPWVAPFNPFYLGSIQLLDDLLLPMWLPKGMREYWMGTDSQGRDLLALLLFGLRNSLLICFSFVILAMLFGSVLGLI